MHFERCYFKINDENKFNSLMLEIPIKKLKKKSYDSHSLINNLIISFFFKWHEEKYEIATTKIRKLFNN